MRKQINLGFPKILGTVRKVNVPQPWFADKGYSGGWASPEDVLEGLRKASKYETDSDDLGGFAYTTVIPYLDPFDMWVRNSYDIQVDNYKEFLKSGKKFIAPILASEFRSAQWGESVSEIDRSQRFPNKLWKGAFPEDLLEALRTGQAFLLFYSLWEIGVYYPEDVNRFVEDLKIPITSIILGTPNTECKKLYEQQESKPHLIYWNSFLDIPWGIPPYNHRPEQYSRWKKQYQNLNRSSKFLCLSRRWSPERLFLGGYLRAKHTYSSIVSQGVSRNVPLSDKSGEAACRDIKSVLHKQSDTLETVLRFYQKTFGNEKSICCSPDLDVENGAMDNATWPVQDLQNQAYINVVTETCFPYDSGIFFTEKIYKPVWNLQPFILVAAPHSLQRFQKLGFKTFERWWDERYDEIEDNQLRLEAICRVIDDLDTRSLEEIHQMYLEMEEVLTHNFNLFTRDAVLKNYPAVQEQIFDILS